MEGSQGSSGLPAPPPLKTRSVGEILESAFELYRRYWGKLVTLVAIVVVPLTLLQYLLVELFSEDSNGEVDAATAWQGAFLAIASIFISLLLTGAIAWAVATILIGREPDISDCYRNGYRRIWSILLVSLLSGLAIALGLIAFVIPGLFLLTRFSASIPAVVIERRKGTDALSRSWELVKGYGWHVFGALVVTWLLTGIVNGILTSLGGSNWLVRGILGTIASILTMPYTALVVGLLYFDLRVRKENLDVPTLEREVQAAAM
jgi:hypothetical protein